MVDAAEGVLGIEWIEGRSVRFLLGGGAEDEVEVEEDEEEDLDDVLVAHAADALREYGITQGEQPVLVSAHELTHAVETLMQLIGREIAKMHVADIIHGDLTTSNMMLRPAAPAAELVLIDFGLAYISTLIEDKAVDLYVLERAFASTHPDSSALFEGVLNAYETHIGPKAWKNVKGRLDEGQSMNSLSYHCMNISSVRMRGRKRSMVG